MSESSKLAPDLSQNIMKLYTMSKFTFIYAMSIWAFAHNFDENFKIMIEIFFVEKIT
jgi:hypothetical protein